MLITCLLFVLAVHIFYSGLVCNGSDTLLPGQSLFTNQTLVSKGGKFELGFFNPGNSTNYYLGIWYKRIPVQTVVWVFNRDDPIPHSYYNYSRLELFSSGSLLVYPGFGVQLLPYDYPNASEAVILDTGNFVVRDDSGYILWQSFNSPTDTWLPGMKLQYYQFLDEFSRQYLSGYTLFSWTSPNDPAPGNYSFQADSGELSTRFNFSVILWGSGDLRGGAFASLPDYSGFSISYNFTYIIDPGDGEYFMYNVFDESLMLRIVIDYRGGLTHFRWSDGRQAWIVLYSNTGPKYGLNIICNDNWSPACRCLDGFVPRDKQEWNLSHFPNECVRNNPLECARDKARYINVTTTTLPDNPQSLKVPNHDACNLACSDSCSCTAYAYFNHGGGGCLLFLGNLSALVSPPNYYVGVDLYIKTESAHTSRTLLVVALIVPIIAAVLIISCFCFWHVMWPKLKNNESRVTHQDLLQLDLNSSLQNRDAEEKNSRYELPVFSFSSIATSTNNFSITNRLGEGGFGPVYKGEVHNGQFVAVKRLSRRSGQGVQEFKNETELIAKLQHRNLVGILGCCTENDEMILVYEYMSNKSLDFFLFEPSTKKELLDWQRRVHIIKGIAQGLLYLHHYSRIRIIHRDLKASNILLDAEMNPKISDFGMARIFGGNDMQANTKRIVGTYGYMSPEYAMEGLFSMKSDVFAFGVLMLEIMSGKKNMGFYGSDYLSLLGYAWELWKHDSALELMDSTLEIPDSSSSIPLRLIQISLLCVEENPADRPLISDVVGMLNNERRAIPSPHNPAFTVGRTSAKAAPTHHKVEICSVNDLTVSNVEAR